VQGKTPDNRLCSEYQEVQVASFELVNDVPGTPTPNLTTGGLLSLGLMPLTGGNGATLQPSLYSFVALDATPSVALTLAPATGDTTQRKWQLELDTNLELNTVTFGLVGPTGADTNTMRFTGCTTLSGSPATRRICAANAALGPYVASTISFTVGPGATSGLRGDTLYVSLKGNRNSGAPLAALNVANQPVILGVVEVDGSPIQPSLTLDGVATSAVFGSSAYTDTSGALVPTPSVQLGGGYNAPADFDADGRSDDLDNCPYTSNNSQANNGGVLTITPDLYGDACQCGEGDGNGAVFAADAAVLRGVLAGTVQTSAVVSRCSVAGGPECDIRDSVVLRRALAGLAPAISAVCTSAVRSTQLPAAP
ncbi:MAG: thrombospondin type 3 repeat-containing protein, partial [Myxococcota bacterium]